MIFDRKTLEHYPVQPGVYLMKDIDHKVIYVGKAKQIKVRLKQYFSATPDSRPMVPYLIEEIAFIDTIVVDSEKEALLLENTLIKKHQPKYNAFLKDDKSYISLMVNHHHRYPMLRLIRYKGKPQEEGLYFGPYTSAYAARQTYELLTQLFPLRQCSDEELKRRTRPCLLYGIKRCCAPCVKKCTQEEYDGYVQSTIRFLRGQDKEMLKDLYTDMHKASQELEYERAASILKIIRHIEHVLEANQLVVKVDGKNTDALAIYREGRELVLTQLIFREGKLIGSEHFSFSQTAEDDEELITSFILQHYTNDVALPDEILIPVSIKDAAVLVEILKDRLQKKMILIAPQKGEKLALIDLAKKNAKASFEREKDRRELNEKMLLDLQDTLKLNRYPKRIECFDTSHISGQEPVAALIAFTEGEKDTKRTRLFRMKTVKSADEYGYLREVLRRHLARAKQADELPDLIIVDGGKGQLNTAIEIFKELDIATVDLIAVAKQAGLHTKGMTQEKVFLRDQHEAIILNPRSHLLLLLQKIRDEAHRKAIHFHRTRRKKKSISSVLDELSGIGPIKKARLLRHFGSVQQIQKASEEELLSIKGITKKDLDALRNL